MVAPTFACHRRGRTGTERCTRINKQQSAPYGMDWFAQDSRRTAPRARRTPCTTASLLHTSGQSQPVRCICATTTYLKLLAITLCPALTWMPDRAGSVSAHDKAQAGPRRSHGGQPVPRGLLGVPHFRRGEPNRLPLPGRVPSRDGPDWTAEQAENKSCLRHKLHAVDVRGLWRKHHLWSARGLWFASREAVWPGSPAPPAGREKGGR